MARKPASTKWVTMDERKFIVALDEEGRPLSIKERALYSKGTLYEGWCNKPLWHHSSPLGGAESLPRRVLKSASVPDKLLGD